MLTIPEVIEEIVRNSPFLEEGLYLGILNLSSLARRIKPQIQKTLLKDVQDGAIIMALKRIEDKIQLEGQKNKKILPSSGDISVKSNLVEFTFTNSPSLLDKLRELLLIIDREKNAFLTFSHGIYETTLIVSGSMDEQVQNIFKYEHLKSKFTQLSAITLMLAKESVEISGVYYNILKNLAWEGINIVEVVSNYTELTIILENEQVNRAFTALKQLA